MDLLHLRGFLNMSHYEMAGWELIPSTLIALIFVGGGLQVLKARKGGKARNRRSEHARKRIPIPLIIATPATQPFSVTAYDISLGGAFIPFEGMKNSMNITSFIGKRSGLKVGDVIDIKMYTGRFTQIHFQGRVVRLEDSSVGEYPKGVGIQFIKMSRRDQKKLEHLLYSEDNQEVAI